MSKTKIKEDALLDLTNLASWVHLDARMEADEGTSNILICVDKGLRKAKVRPLLEKLGYANIPVSSLSELEAPISKWNTGPPRFAAAKMRKDKYQ